MTITPGRGRLCGDDADPDVEAFNQRCAAMLGARPCSQDTGPSCVMIAVVAVAVERTGTTRTGRAATSAR